MKLKDIKYLQLGNRKLPITTAIFNLPSKVTCPGKTALCSKVCYATKAERMYKQVIPFRTKNLTLSQQEIFIEVITNEIETLVEKKKLKTVRIHESGDFYSQKYLDKWLVIANKFPKIIFYAYTKSWHLNLLGHFLV